MKRLLILTLLLFLSVELLANTSTIIKLQIQGAIGPAGSSYIKEGMAYAAGQNAQAVLIELDTPGGLSTSMREMIQEITNSSIPVITYVYPKGAHAASAGTYLLYASHIAAMAPATNLGAATPVRLMPSSAKIEDSNTSTTSTLEKKAVNDAIAYIKSLAELNDRNVTWAISAVKESKSLSAEDALKYGVIDIVAEDIKELLDKLQGKIVVISGKNITLKTEGAIIELYEADWKTRFLSIITNPNIAYIFLLLAIYGIFFELMNPGAIIPGVIGTISGVIALYALNMIPFNYAGLLLILLGIVFMISEVFIAGFGILGIGGVISFAFGSFLLFDADTLGSSVSIPLIIAFSVSSLAFFILVVRLFVSSRSAKVVSGEEEMIGTTAEVIKSNDSGYLVHCHGETWSATSETKLSVGQSVQVVELSGLILKVKPIEE
ncbi:nodulation protein NfeD [Sulfurimonas sp.]|uniref:NfeD family protein n=1 Tax=Sulfurimonas sp. TaxID=2022749 RepID=UPI0026245A3D|nr:nodulation protein NfeD [Sulfurimonas sp.]MCW8894408.1 nodulation protein NfeD [Sulfurimonas sp.]MCW9068345.1 nodulation protein NfeD [Sulfurimonas sp.]